MKSVVKKTFQITITMKHAHLLPCLLLPFLATLAPSTALAAPTAQTPPSPPGRGDGGEGAGASQHVYKKVAGRSLHAHVLTPPDWKATDKRPALVFYHGGGWVAGNPAGFIKEQGAYLASRGMVVISIEYRLLSRGDRSPPIICTQDAKSSFRWVRANAAKLGIDPDRIAAAGGSAGGQMAASIALTPGHDDPADDLKIPLAPAALVLFNPAIGFPDDPATIAKLAVRFSPEALKFWRTDAPLHHLVKTAPPMLILSGENDNVVPMKMLQQFQARAKELGVRCDAVFYPGQGHAFFHKDKENGKYYHATLLEIDKFLTSLGWLQGPPTLKPPPSSDTPAAPAKSQKNRKTKKAKS